MKLEAYPDTIYSTLENYKENQGICLTKMQVPLPSSQEPDKPKMWGVKLLPSLYFFDNSNSIVIIQWFFFLIYKHITSYVETDILKNKAFALKSLAF